MQSSSCWSFKIVELSLQISKEQCSVILCNTAVMTPVHDSNPRMCGHLKPDNPVHTAVFFLWFSPVRSTVVSWRPNPARDLRAVLHFDGADLLEAPLHDILALQHELTALALEVLLLPDSDPPLSHLLHHLLLCVHGCCVVTSLSTIKGDKEDQQ